MTERLLRCAVITTASTGLFSHFKMLGRYVMTGDARPARRHGPAGIFVPPRN